MSAELVHAPKGAGIGLLIGRAFAAAGMGWLGLLVTPVVTFIAHLIWDRVPHFDVIHAASQPEFETARSADPKELVHNLVKTHGLRKIIFAKDARYRGIGASLLPSTPTALVIPPIAMKLAYADVGLSGILALFLAGQALDDPLLAGTMLAGAFGAVLPDLLLPAFIYNRLIRYTWFWRLDMVHHWCHARIIDYKYRWWGLVSQIAFSAAFIILTLWLL